MDHLGIQHAPLVGHSMGGTVSLATAIHYPQKVSRVAVIGSPIAGESLAPLLKLAGRRWTATIAYNSMWALRLGIGIASPIVTRDSRWPQMIGRDLSKTTLESFLLSIASLRKTDLRPQLNQLRIPVLGMYGDNDIVVHPDQWKPLQNGISDAHIHRFADAGHFIMLDEPVRFMDILHRFLDAD
jgi:pimeloyl-ACP methyl ester carboxylesterase